MRVFTAFRAKTRNLIAPEPPKFGFWPLIQMNYAVFINGASRDLRKKLRTITLKQNSTQGCCFNRQLTLFLSLNAHQLIFNTLTDSFLALFSPMFHVKRYNLIFFSVFFV